MGMQHITAVLRYSRAAGSDRLALVVIANAINDTHGCTWEGSAELARKAKLGPREWRRCLETLRTLGELVSIARPGRDNIHAIPPYAEEGGEALPCQDPTHFCCRCHGRVEFTAPTHIASSIGPARTPPPRPQAPGVRTVDNSSTNTPAEEGVRSDLTVGVRSDLTVGYGQIRPNGTVRSDRRVRSDLTGGYGQVRPYSTTMTPIDPNVTPIDPDVTPRATPVLHTRKRSLSFPDWLEHVRGVSRRKIGTPGYPLEQYRREFDSWKRSGHKLANG